MIRIAIADDHKLFGETLCEMLNAHPGFEVIALCQNSEEIIEIAIAEKPDIILLDINIPPFSGIEATQKLAARTSCKVIGLSMHAHPSYFKNMMQMGARGYVTKNSSKEEIFKAVLQVYSGNKYICSEIKNAISGQLLEGDTGKPNLGVLTGRELEIINFIKEGFSSKEIAGKFFIALKTVEVHRHNILKKLKLKNSTSLVNFVHRNGGY